MSLFESAALESKHKNGVFLQRMNKQETELANRGKASTLR
jgi:hypothetical protein